MSRVLTPYNGPRVWVKGVKKIISDRINEHGEEEYLLVWRTENGDKNYPPMSWQTVNELDVVLGKLQDYLDSLSSAIATSSRKRPSPAGGHEPRDSPAGRARRLDDRNRSLSRDHLSTTAPTPSVYNGKRTVDTFITVESDPTCANRLRLSEAPVPVPWSGSGLRFAEEKIRDIFRQRLRLIPGPKVKLINDEDNSTPSLNFQFIESSICRPGVEPLPKETLVGCSQCKPHMGRNIGCEYSKKCDCLEYAEVMVKSLNDEEMEQYERAQQGLDTFMGLPKRFPYLSTDNLNNGCLQNSYLNSRNTIYECNETCPCGSGCKNRNVQHGRKVPLEIFKTKQRGWGLRCTVPLHKGQFIDTYRGEIITSETADKRESKSGRASKVSYLYSLDKFKDQPGFEGIEEFHVVDGQYFGGPTRFINHSCKPNCRQYAVSFNKHDPMVYEIAFFAIRDIGSGEELTFDYMDNDDIDEEEEAEEVKKAESGEQDGNTRTRCLCGARGCRKWLWI